MELNESALHLLLGIWGSSIVPPPFSWCNNSAHCSQSAGKLSRLERASPECLMGHFFVVRTFKITIVLFQ